ncbi:MAG: tRNA dimethylallyltransferase, partial [Phycisphaeraceae bacterium]|nr:tRNA dimethylallyltransferase [Phycisphaeraceae bacterium]
NLYIKALLEGLFDGPPRDPELRDRLEEVDGEELHERLAKVDPEAADRIHPNDQRRVVRAMEVWELTGRPISDWQNQWRRQREKPYRHDPILLGLRWPTQDINHRINRRVRAFFYPDKAREEGLEAPDQPLPDEVKRLHAAGRLGEQASEALGYKQVLAALNGEMSLDDAFEETKIQTRRFAKQQRTWLKRFRNVHWLDATRDQPPLIDRAMAAVTDDADAG